jgi:hypothetical protein
MKWHMSEFCRVAKFRKTSNDIIVISVYRAVKLVCFSQTSNFYKLNVRTLRVSLIFVV